MGTPVGAHRGQPGDRRRRHTLPHGRIETPEAITGAVGAYREAGADELILDPTVPDPDQVDLLAEVVL